MGDLLPLLALESSDDSSCSPGSAASSETCVPSLEVVSPSRSKATWTREYDLPPCRVCGRAGSGLHYGVNTCDPCKGFFQRSFVHRDKYVCRKDNRCELLKSRGNMCPYCRLQKCLQVGMSKEGIKHGRYLLDKKRNDIRELKQIKASKTLASMLIEEERKRPSVEKLVVTISNSRVNYSKVCDQYEEYMCKLDIEYVKQHEMRKCLIEDILHTYTGSREHSSIFQNYYKWVDLVNRRVIKFVKAIPGFKDLNLADQMTLLQDSHADVRFLNGIFIYHRVFVDVDLLSLLVGNAFALYSHKVSNRYVNLGLKPEEVAVLMAFALFDGSTSRLTEPHKAEAIHSQLLCTLQWLLARNHPEQRMLFPKVVETLTAVRTFSKMDEDFRVTMFQVLGSETTKLPPLLRELTPLCSAPRMDLTSTLDSYVEKLVPL